MQKRDKAIRDIYDEKILEEIILQCKTCHVGFVNGDKPYVLGFNFGYSDKTVYLHCAKEGHKIDILKNNPYVCVYFDTDHHLFARHEHVACSWRMRYRSVQIMGKVEFVENFDEKLKGLEIFMKQYSDMNFQYSKPAVDNILILKIKVDSWQGRSFEFV